MKPGGNTKSPLLAVLLILPFAVTTTAYMPWFVAKISSASESVNAIYTFWTITVIFIWFCGYRNTSVVLLSAFRSGKNIYENRDPPERRRVAVLYLCCDDFDSSALQTFLAQTYGNYVIFVLDDSTVNLSRKTVDEFCARHGIVVIRRDSRRGYKAGAINNALRHLSPDIEFLAIADSDERVPKDFVERSVTVLGKTNDEVAFVQCRLSVVSQATRFAQVLGERENFHWFFQGYRNNYGLVQFLGHGALVKRKPIEEVGGFPEVVSEDIALTYRLRQAGYRGLFLNSVACSDGFPSDYFALRNRNKRWTKGHLQTLVDAVPRFLRAPKVTFVEKLDTITSMLTMPVSGLLFFGFWLSVAPAGLEAVLDFFRYDVAGLMALAYFAPTVCILLSQIRKPSQLATYFGLAALYPAQVLALLMGILEYGHGKTTFDITSKQATPAPLRKMLRLGWREFAAASVLITYLAIFRAIFDIPLIIIAASLVFSPLASILLDQNRLERRTVAT